MTDTLRPELPPLPERIQRLPVLRGYPVPWFVGLVDGVPDFRVLDSAKFVRAVREHRCWVCGQPNGSFLAFTIGPMCAINRVSSEPPSHRECAEFSVRACPFLSRPHMRRRDGLPEEVTPPAGFMLDRNPGVAMVWVTKEYQLIKTTAGPAIVGNTLFRMGRPREVLCYAEGRPATLEEIRVSVEGGFPSLLAAAETEGPVAVRELHKGLAVARQLLKIA